MSNDNLSPAMREIASALDLVKERDLSFSPPPMWKIEDALIQGATDALAEARAKASPGSSTSPAVVTYTGEDSGPRL